MKIYNVPISLWLSIVSDDDIPPHLRCILWSFGCTNPDTLGLIVYTDRAWVFCRCGDL